MKYLKLLIIFFIMLFFHASCILKQNLNDDISDVLKGTWEISPEEFITFNENKTWIYSKNGTIVNGTYYTNVEYNNHPHWIWQGDDETYNIMWESEFGETGQTTWLGYFNNDCQILIMKNIYNHNEAISLLKYYN